MPMKNPSHPGLLVRECIDSAELTITAAAERLGVARQTLINLVNEQGGISPEMAVRLEKFGWSSADHWMRMQMAYDLAQVRIYQDDIQVHPSGP